MSQNKKTLQVKGERTVTMQSTLQNDIYMQQLQKLGFSH